MYCRLWLSRLAQVLAFGGLSTSWRVTATTIRAQNDKDTNQPICTADEAKEKAEKILIDHFGGFTIQEAHGGWKDDGVIYQEYTLVIYLSDTTLDEVHAGADDLIKAFNQSSVLIQANETSTEFYSSVN